MPMEGSPGDKSIQPLFRVRKTAGGVRAPIVVSWFGLKGHQSRHGDESFDRP